MKESHLNVPKKSHWELVREPKEKEGQGSFLIEQIISVSSEAALMAGKPQPGESGKGWKLAGITSLSSRF